MLLGDLYKTPRAHEVNAPRTGDLAEIRRSHCVPERGLLVEVKSDPIIAWSQCSHCGQGILEPMVEVHTLEPDWQGIHGPWLMPIAWLRRIDPRDPVQYDRVVNYEANMLSDEAIAKFQ